MMFIVSKDRDNIINTSQITNIFAGGDGYTVKAAFANGSGCQIGRYSRPVANKVIEMIGLAAVPFSRIQENGFTLSPNLYLPEEIEKEEIDIDAVNKQVVFDLLEKVDGTFRALIDLQRQFDDEFYIKDLYTGLEVLLEKYAKEVRGGETPVFVKVARKGGGEYEALESKIRGQCF